MLNVHYYFCSNGVLKVLKTDLTLTEQRDDYMGSSTKTNPCRQMQEYNLHFGIKEYLNITCIL